MVKKLLLFFVFAFGALSVYAQDNATTKTIEQDSTLCSTTFYFRHGNRYWIDYANFSETCIMYYTYKSHSKAKIKIEAWADSSGEENENATISQERANTIRKYFLKEGVRSEDIILVKGYGVDFNAETDSLARRADARLILSVIKEVVAEEPKEVAEVAKEEPIEVAAVIKPAKTDDARAAEPIEEIDTQMQVEPETTPETKAEETTIADASTPTTTDSKSCFEWNYFTPRTNLLYWLGGMMNLGVEYKKPESDFGFLVNGGFSPFGDTEWNHNLGGWFVAPEVRYYFPSNDQWFVGAQFLAAGYNFKLSDTGKQGTVIGGGVVGGYKLTLSDTFDMDFTLGLGYGRLKYDTYYHDEATGTNPYIEKGITKNSLIPIQAGVNLIWKFK